MLMREDTPAHGGGIELSIEEGCCIECAAKRAYQEMVSNLLSSAEMPDAMVEYRLQLLIDFLEQADFSSLRSSDENLAGTKSARCLLSRRQDGAPVVSIIPQ